MTRGVIVAAPAAGIGAGKVKRVRPSSPGKGRSG